MWVLPGYPFKKLLEVRVKKIEKDLYITFSEPFLF